MIALDAKRTSTRLFGALDWQPPDALLALIDAYAKDPRLSKIDLGVGVFRDDHGRTPVMQAVKAAEAILLAEQSTKTYLGAEGDTQFVDLLAAVAFGESPSRSLGLRGLQTPGGTGALRLAAELIVRANPDATVWVGSPSWPNHVPIFAAAGLSTLAHPFFDSARGEIDFGATMASLEGLVAGDVVLLHGCCHNPTGADFSLDQWAEIGELLARRGATPLIDLAYQGLGDGLEPDAAGMALVIEAVPDALIAYSCDKNFGLYRERVGALWIKAENETHASVAFANLLTLARCLWSMPPDHGAAIVRTVLNEPDLRELWSAELDSMRGRINRLRAALAAAHPRLSPLADQRGLFATLPISTEHIAALRDEHGIYIAGSGRINVAGLHDTTIPIFADAVGPMLALEQLGSPR